MIKQNKIHDLKDIITLENKFSIKFQIIPGNFLLFDLKNIFSFDNNSNS